MQAKDPTMQGGGLARPARVGRREAVAWAWAVNGFCSVVASVLATILAMSFGFHAVLGLAAVIYAVGVAALLRIPDPARIGGGNAADGPFKA